VYTMKMENITVKIDGKHRLFVDNELIADTSHVRRPLRFEGKTLPVNAEVAEGGHCLVGFRLRRRSKALKNFTAEDCRLFTVHSINKTVTWKPGEDISKLSHSFSQVEFRPGNAQLYSFWSEDDQPTICVSLHTECGFFENAWTSSLRGHILFMKRRRKNNS